MGNSNLLFESIFNRKLSDADTRQYLVKITNEHPYFSPAQFFLLLLTEKGTAAYQELAARTSVLFNNPYWLQFQLQEKQQNTEEISDAIVKNDNKFIPAENQEDISAEITEPAEPFDKGDAINIDIPAKEIIEESAQALAYDEPVPSQMQKTAIDIITEKEGEPVVDETVPLFPGESIRELSPENVSEPITAGDILSEQENNTEGAIAEKEILPVLNEQPASSRPEPEKEEVIAEKEIRFNNENVFSTIPENEDKIIDPVHSGHFNNENSPLVNEPETEEDPIPEQEIGPLNFKLNIDTANITEENITFEPLHTSDYFASQGIKLSGEIKPSDKLGKQLKSFTEWLKTMKKIHGDQLAPLSGQADISIQKLAEQSNKEDAVVTEAMADVLLRQGKAEKAIEVYKKLSLLNPSKSTYFAAKIDQLKEH